MDNNKLFDNLENLPNAAFKDVTEKPASASSPSDTPDLNKEVFETGAHTEKPGEDTKTVPGAKVTEIKEKVTIGKIIEGEYATDLLNIFLPSILVALAYALGFVFKKEHFELTPKEKKVLAIPVQACLDTIVIDFSNPWVNLSIIAGLIYGSKIADRIPVGIQRAVKKQQAPAKVVPIETPVKQQPQQQTPAPNQNERTVEDFETGKTIKTTDINFNNQQAPIEQPAAVNNQIPEFEKAEKLTNDDGEFSPQEWDLILTTADRRKKGRPEAVRWLKGRGKLPLFKL